MAWGLLSIPVVAEPKTLLIVEDDAATRDHVASHLQDEGFATIGVGSGEEAIPLARRAQPDAILLDLGLPGIDGWETLRRLQSLGETRAIPIVLLTCRDSVDDLLRGYVNGASYYVAKPWAEGELVRGVRMALAER